MKVIIFLLLFLGFAMLFRGIRFLEQMKDLLQKTRWGMDAAARKRALDSRRRLLNLQREHTIWTVLERELYYSGLKLRFTKITAEIWLAGNLAICALLTVVLTAAFDIRTAALGNALFIAGELVFLRRLRTANLRRVNEHLMKLLDFLGNYSITAGEVTGILHQVSRYMEDPIKTVLETCYYEAQTSGDASLALLSMAEKIEHPKFKELARNMEISLRYCADFTLLVSSSRRSLREYLRVSRERKGMLREAILNMALLVGMSLVVLASVGYLVQVPMRELLFGTLPGRVGLIVLAVIGILFSEQLRKVHC